MTPAELLAQVEKAPETILNMSDAELAAHLAPLIPLARAPYVGKDSKEAMILHKGGRRVKAEHISNKIAQLNAILGIENNQTL